MNTAYVYAVLVDGVVRYIGKGTSRRRRDHLYKATRIVKYGPAKAVQMRATRFHKRLAEALAAGAVITDRLLAGGLSDACAYERERAEIAKLPAGQLWNIDLGGHGPTSEGMRLAMASPEIRARISQGTIAGLTPEVLARRRVSQIAVAGRPENRAKKVAAANRNAADPEYRARLASAMARPETREKISAAAKRRGAGRSGEEWKVLLADPERRARLSAKRKALWADPEYREKVLARQKEAQANPEYRARMSVMKKALYAAKRAAQ